jgi:ubiquinone/menaquinone biosynthesis C-methylase UbiE
MTGFSRETLIDIYRKRAKHYDLYAGLMEFVGFRQSIYRKKAIQALYLQRGDTVVDIGCGTGLNFSLLEEAIGPEGRIIGVDLTYAMLAQAQERVRVAGWQNVLLIQSDASTFTFPSEVDGILSTFALTLVPEFDHVILKGCRALKPGKRWGIADFKMPSGVFSKLAPLLALVFVRPFGGTIDLASRHPWESMNKYLQQVEMTEFYMGSVYVAAGERGASGCG